MIPDTVAAIVAFFGFVAPGIAFELRRERRRQAIAESAFREASRTALASIAFSGLAVAALVLLSHLFPAHAIDLSAWIRSGKGYVAAHPATIGWNVLAFLALSVGSALLFEWLTGRGSTPTVRNGTIWYEIFGQSSHPGDKVWVCVHLKDGDQLYGYVERYSLADPQDSPDLYLVGSGLTWRHIHPQRDAPAERRGLDESWDGIYVPSSEIIWIRVAYLPSEDDT